MKNASFEIGSKFYTTTGQCWLCTDVGIRTILAIELDPKLDKNWFKGPPYAVKEVVFDEEEMEMCFRNEEEHITERLENHIKSNHPSFSAEVVWKMMDIRHQFSDYPHKRLFRINRVDESGEIYHPYAAEKEGDEWMILVYLPFTGEFKKVKESIFIGYDLATEEDLFQRKTKL
ncbi:hypothetical protein [Entomomonas moraniae]|uniref:hypothetical protein n=1 Tax=Entomomonas moraniae TaxID=2213226 RepID=UPI0015B1E6A5|nr:hypothetical protein [Entomomonas moraniae]